MYVCICKGITEAQIRVAVTDGAKSMRAVRNTLGVTSQCGQCAIMAREIVRQTLLTTTDNEHLFRTNDSPAHCADRCPATITS